MVMVPPDGTVLYIVVVACTLIFATLWFYADH